MKQTIILGGGCFWCVEAAFQMVQGVESAESGYAAGQTLDPTYEQVSQGNTGHAEVVKVTFDAEEISLREILTIFFTIHNPTTPNQQGADIGTQYRSIVLYTDDAQREVILDVMEEMALVWDDQIVTEVEQLDHFYPAEEYHQRYFENNPTQGYCQAVISPKLSKLRKEYFSYLKPED